MHRSRRTSSRTFLKPRRDQGFTLVELLVVIVLIVILLALLIPALSGARSTAKAAATKTLMVSVSNAAAAFKIDEQRLPGAFSATAIGNQANDDLGLTYMENAILDLAGAYETRDPEADGFTRIQMQSANGTEERWVNPGLIASKETSKYLELGEDLVVVEGQAGDLPDGIEVPDVIDNFGVPVLMWARDGFAGQDAPIASESSTDEIAQFYWAGNLGYTDSGGLGDKLWNQSRYSLLGTGGNDGSGTGAGYIVGGENFAATVAAIVGHPGFPTTAAAGGGSGGGQPTTIVPGQARGDVVLQSAGKDGLYVSNRMNRSKFGYFRTAVYMPAEGSNENIPDNAKPIDQFDDIILGGGN